MIVEKSGEVIIRSDGSVECRYFIINGAGGPENEDVALFLIDWAIGNLEKAKEKRKEGRN